MKSKTKSLTVNLNDGQSPVMKLVSTTSKTLIIYRSMRFKSEVSNFYMRHNATVINRINFFTKNEIALLIPEKHYKPDLLGFDKVYVESECSIGTWQSVESEYKDKANIVKVGYFDV